MFRALRYSLEYTLAKGALDWISSHSLEKCTARTTALARTWYRLDSKRRKLAVRNIMLSGITDDPAKADKIARNALLHFALVVIESLKSRDVLTKENWKDKVELSIPAETMELLEKKGQPVLLLSGHIGNWEVAARLLSFMKPVTGITRDAKNPRVNELMKQHKPSENFTLTPKHDVDPTRLLSVLKKGEILALLIDQYAMSHGIELPFFGHNTSVHKSPALLHLVTKTPIVFGVCIRKGPMQFRFEASEPLSFKPSGKREDDIKRLLTDLTHRMEAAIRDNPEQYLWVHNRWR